MPFPYHVNFNAPSVVVQTAERLKFKVGDVSLSRLYRAGMLIGLQRMLEMDPEEIAVAISRGDGLK